MKRKRRTPSSHLHDIEGAPLTPGNFCTELTVIQGSPVVDFMEKLLKSVCSESVLNGAGVKAVLLVVQDKHMMKTLPRADELSQIATASFIAVVGEILEHGDSVGCRGVR